MVYELIIIFLLILFIMGEFFIFKRQNSLYDQKRRELFKDIEGLRKEDNDLKEKVEDLEKKMGEYFFFYELARKIAPILDKKKLFTVFFEEIKFLGEVQEVKSPDYSKEEDYLEYKLGEDSSETLRLRTRSKKVIRYLPHFVKLLSLCIERINLYLEFQQLSIYDSLTEIYNRRYFMLRFIEEFNRAKKFNLNLSFLMVDIDYFKKINDNYGHLVGDVVLKETAQLLKQNMREIDFVARFGGEEFSIILCETNKERAQMVAERICAAVSQEKIHAFDEVLSVTVSIGAASFPENTIYSDFLIEAADKALYQAKVSGRNRAFVF